MQATYGSAVRSGIRTIGLAAAVLALSALLFASTAGAAGAKKINPTQTYLAMGDSLAFGYSQQLFNENEKLGEPPTAFEHGYANNYWNKHKPFETHLALTNQGCPGETTDSMIGNGPLGAALELFAEAHGEAPCAYHYAAGLPLHHEYGGTKSQLESTLEQIAFDEATGVPVTTLSLDIGANDQLRAVKKCEAEVKTEYELTGKSAQYGGNTPEESVRNCLSVHTKETFEHILKNIGASLFAIREGSKFGGVNYLGKIVIQGGYDPFGSVFVVEHELLESSTFLVKLLNQEEKKVGEKFGACFANPEPTFNPLVIGKGKLEPAALQKFTNMANTTEFEGKKNGPDIHPTPLGYAKLGAIMLKECGL
jgi:hypothetical protein